MNRNLLLITAILLLPLLSVGQTITQYFDGADTSALTSILIDIEPDTQNLWQIGPPQKTLFDTAFTAPNAIVTDTINRLQSRNISRFVVRIPDTALRWGILALQWVQKLDMAYDLQGGMVEFSRNTDTNC